jgi:hypothetical protein
MPGLQERQRLLEWRPRWARLKSRTGRSVWCDSCQPSPVPRWKPGPLPQWTQFQYYFAIHKVPSSLPDSFPSTNTYSKPSISPTPAACLCSQSLLLNSEHMLPLLGGSLGREWKRMLCS